MRNIFAVILLLFTVFVVWLLDGGLAPVPALGRLLDPVNGCMANAENVHENFNGTVQLAGCTQPVTIWIDNRLVPHIHAANDHDVYYAEGYIHARFRLWQMDMEARAAGGRVSEVIGEKGLGFDRKQRRKGMVYAAENSLRAMEAEPRTKAMMDAYTAGINAWIAGLNYRQYPVEYKLIGFAPEKWTNLKSALLLKYMADDLTGSTDDIALTYLRDALPKGEFDLLFPEKIAGSSPVIPKGTVFDKPSLAALSAPPDSLAFPRFKPGDFGETGDQGKGSNNWALSGTRTQSGAAILCNDPHLGLNLPSLWYEAQLQTPDMNVYGASLPGAPGVIIGFNSDISWGFTNNYRDVKDFYLIKQSVNDTNKYWFNGKEVPYAKRAEHIGIKGGKEYIDTVRYTVQGPVMYEASFPAPGGFRKPLAVTWMAHKGTNELLAVYLMNRAKDYEQFVDGILNFQCPGQNMIYADRKGNIALWGQGQFVNKWPEQGRFIMNGTDSSTMWKELIPMRENPHAVNPPQGYLTSANQSVTDSTYPYWYNGDFAELRAWRLNQVLSGMQHASIADMFALQQDTYSVLAANTLPLMLQHVPPALAQQGKKYLDTLAAWDYRLGKNSNAATYYQVWWSYLYKGLWQKQFKHVPDQLWPLPERTMQLLHDTDFMYSISGSCIPNNRSLEIGNSFKLAMDSLGRLERMGGTTWYQVKNTSVTHLAKLAPFSYEHLPIGGWGNTVNAARTDHGPSWRMVVQMGNEIEAYGVYPGGQSGNPGSRYYADFIQDWADGSYYRLLFLPAADRQNDSNIKYTLSLHP